MIKRVGTDGLVERCLAERETDPGLEPLAVCGNEADQGDRSVADAGGEQDDVVEALLRRGVQDGKFAERLEALSCFR